MVHLLKNLKRIIPRSLGGPGANIYASIIKKQKLNLLSMIADEKRPEKVLEVGVGSGDGAESMIVPQVNTEYYGFDYFDGPTKEEIREKLEDENTEVFLFEGDVKETISKHISDIPKMDMIHIDLSGAGKKECERFAWKKLKSLLHSNSVLIMAEDSFIPDKNYQSNRYNLMLKKKNLVVVRKTK